MGHGSQQGLVPVELPCVLLVEGVGEGEEVEEATSRQEEEEEGGEAHDAVTDVLVFDASVAGC